MPVVPVHPRVCGEHAPVLVGSGAIGGSSPRVRGTRTPLSQSPALPRFIPACAGNTSGTTGAASAVSVHPRVCGEHSERTSSRTVSDGSSPRVRGTLCARMVAGIVPRFIPACAGNTV